MSGPYRKDPPPPCEACARRNSERWQAIRKVVMDCVWGVPGAVFLVGGLLFAFCAFTYDHVTEEAAARRYEATREEACQAECYVRDYTRATRLDGRCICRRYGRRAIEVTP